MLTVSPHIFAIVGATGTGKTTLSLYVAEYLAMNGKKSAIVNMDSRQVYSAFPIVSAQPTPEEMSLVQHHFYGHLPLNAIINVHEYTKNVAITCQELWKNNIIPILVGGTGMYFHVLCNGIAPIPDIDEQIRLQERNFVLTNKEHAYQKLVAIDPIFAQSIQQGDTQRIARGLEVFYSTGKPLSQWYEQKKEYNIEHTSIAIQMEPSILETILEQRIAIMLKNGAIEEVEQAYKKYKFTNTHAFSCIGVQEIIQYIEGDYTKEECIKKWLIHTRQYAKRQRTWFRNKHKSTWITYNTYREATQALIDEYISNIPF